MKNDQDLTVSRIIKAPRSAVWKAWKDPEHFVKWWAPAPVKTISNKHELYPGGGFDTTMILEDGTVMECGEGWGTAIDQLAKIAEGLA